QRVGDRTERGVDRVVPRADHAHDTERMVFDTGGLIRHQVARGAAVGAEYLLGVFRRPRQVFDGEGDFELCVAVWFAGLRVHDLAELVQPPGDDALPEA